MERDKWRGVNLGGWLVLEKWMTPSLFTGLQASDEYGLCQELGKETSDILRLHRENFITETDFKWIADHGLNAIRVPVGYWIFGNEKPFIGGIQYLDQAIVWAEKYGLAVIIDLHGVPGSQNGKDHSGRVGKIGWKTEENIKKTLQTIEKLAKRYAGTPSLAGIELINEPQLRLSKRRLVSFYQRGYETVRKHCGPEVAVVISDAFHPLRWRRVLTGSKYQNVILDVHWYQVHGWRDRRRPYSRQIRRVLELRRGMLREVSRSHQVIVGEWSAALPANLTTKLNNYQTQLAYRTYMAAQLLAHDETDGWFYWSYKTETGGPWSYRDAFDRGWLPKKFKH